MSEVISFTNRNTLLDNQIIEQAAAIAAVEPLQLPAGDAPLVTSFKHKIEGNYEIARAKTDTDHAIELLYIAYNTTPQEQGAIRVRITAIINSLITAQQNSERIISGAVREARSIGTRLHRELPNWLDVKASGEAEDIRQFVSTELLKLAREIVMKAEGVRNSLGVIVDAYEQILGEIEEVMASSEMALSDSLEANRQIKAEIADANTRREVLDGLVADLQGQIERFEQQALAYGQQAKSAEQKAFWTGVFKSFTQVLSALLPLAALGATGGGAALFGAASVGVMAGQNKGEVDPAKLVEKANLESQRDRQQQIVEDQVREIADLERKRDEATSELVREQMDETLVVERAELDEKKAKLADIQNQLGELLRTLEQFAGEVSQQLREQAGSLRALERQMLDKVEEYEKVRREQAAELIRITLLLDGQRSEQQSIELAVKSLNLSVAALKRSKEIVVEIAFFFKSFSDFLQLIIDDALERVEAYEGAGERESLRRYYLEQLLASTDHFFVTQAAQWLAVGAVSEEFAQVFNDGWSKLNTLSGTYITGDELEAYLEQASLQLKAIAEDRDAASRQRLASLDDYREELERRAAEG